MKGKNKRGLFLQELEFSWISAFCVMPKEYYCIELRTIHRSKNNVTLAAFPFRAGNGRIIDIQIIEELVNFSELFSLGNR